MQKYCLHREFNLCKNLIFLVKTFSQIYRVEEARTETFEETEEKSSYGGYSNDYYSDEDHYATDVETSKRRKKSMYNLHLWI